MCFFLAAGRDDDAKQRRACIWRIHRGRPIINFESIAPRVCGPSFLANRQVVIGKKVNSTPGEGRLKSCAPRKSIEEKCSQSDRQGNFLAAPAFNTP